MPRDLVDKAAARVNHDQLAALLTSLGWAAYAGKPGLYSRWRPVGSEAPSVILPLDDHMEDYRDLLREVIGRLASTRDPQAERMLGRLGSGDLLRDQVRFRKDVQTVAGAISWPAGEDLVTSARKALVAAAKAQRSRRAYYGNRNSKFAQSYLSSVLMGQTEVGSYVVTALPPVDQSFPEKELSPGSSSLAGVASHSGRDITERMVSALESTREALDHFFRNSSMAGFDEGIDDGISYEMTQAVKGLLDQSDGADISVEWDILSSPLETSGEVVLEFEGRDYAPLENACARLAVVAESEWVRVTGTVTLLERPQRGMPGVIRLDVLSGSLAKKLRVRLEGEHYNLALDAHKDGLGFAVTGRQEREGPYYWLYDPREAELVELPRVAGDVEEIPGQERLALPDDLAISTIPIEQRNEPVGGVREIEPPRAEIEPPRAEIDPDEQ